MLSCQSKKKNRQMGKNKMKENNLCVRLTIVVWCLTACNVIIVLKRLINTENMCK